MGRRHPAKKSHGSVTRIHKTGKKKKGKETYSYWKGSTVHHAGGQAVVATANSSPQIKKKKNKKPEGKRTGGIDTRKSPIEERPRDDPWQTMWLKRLPYSGTWGKRKTRHGKNKESR